MKTLKTFLALLIIVSLSTTAFAKQGLLGKAKDVANKKGTNKATKKVKKGGKGSGDDMAVKGGGVPQNSSTKQAPPATAPASTQTTK
ncbi:MAG TPA: hypothetical protein VN922_14725 [Bacteroidia bacterium]|nr:hypothetical protein [Bacteroidia bacterium]